MHTIDIDDDAVYDELKRRAARDRRSLRAYVNLVLERHCGMVLGPEDPESVPLKGDAGGSRTADQLRDLVNHVKPGAVQMGRDLLPKTASEMARAREARRGDDAAENQDSRDDDV